MSDSMAICLSDVLNDSCFPRTLGSDVESPLSSYIPDITVAGVVKFFGMAIGATTALFLMWRGLRIWFMKYKLQYFMRMNVCLFLSITILDEIFGDGTAIHKGYNVYSPVLWNYSAIASLVMLFVRYHWKLPLNITKKYQDVGIVEYKMQSAVTRDRMRRKCVLVNLEAFPPCFPNGWIPVIESRDLEPGEVKGAISLGQLFCVFKGEESGEIFVIDAYCPHLGADLTVGGKVRGDCIECPFHGWRANGRDGTCIRGPGNDPNEEKPPVPAGVKVRKWNSCEANGLIFVWHHAESEEQEPSWDMPIVDEIHTGKWVYRGRTEHVVHCHIQEIPENGADINHLEQLHSTSVFLGCDWMDTNSWLNIVNHHWDPEWRRDETQPHIARIKLGQMTTILGFKIPFSMLDIDIQQIGPATVHLYIKSPFGNGILTQHIIPEGPLTMKVIHQLYTEPAIKPFWAELLIRAEATMFERNIALSQRREYTIIPLPENSPIRSYHHWYRSTFFSENSPNLQTLQDRTLAF